MTFDHSRGTPFLTSPTTTAFPLSSASTFSSLVCHFFSWKRDLVNNEGKRSRRPRDRFGPLQRGLAQPLCWAPRATPHQFQPRLNRLDSLPRAGDPCPCHAFTCPPWMINQYRIRAITSCADGCTRKMAVASRLPGKLSQ